MEIKLTPHQKLIIEFDLSEMQTMEQQLAKKEFEFKQKLKMISIEEIPEGKGFVYDGENNRIVFQ